MDVNTKGILLWMSNLCVCCMKRGKGSAAKGD